MVKKWLKSLSITVAVAIGILALSGCGQKSEGGSNNTSNSIKGTITAAGSSALQPLVAEAAKVFGEKNVGSTINVQGGGSGTGLTQVAQGAVEIGNSDIYAEEKLKEVSKELVDHKVCVVGFVPVVNSKLSIDNLTKDQLIGIFTGSITNWKDLGGPDVKIVIINRPKSSGTRVTFKKYALDGKAEVEGKALTEDSSGAVKKAIESTEGSIGYLASSYVNNKENIKGIKILKFNGVDMNKDNIASGKYPIASYEHMYTKGQPSGLTKAFLDFMVSDDIKPIIEKLGYIPIKEMKIELK